MTCHGVLRMQLLLIMLLLLRLRVGLEEAKCRAASDGAARPGSSLEDAHGWLWSTGVLMAFA